MARRTRKWREVYNDDDLCAAVDRIVCCMIEFKTYAWRALSAGATVPEMLVRDVIANLTLNRQFTREHGPLFPEAMFSDDKLTADVESTLYLMCGAGTIVQYDGGYFGSIENWERAAIAKAMTPSLNKEVANG